MIGNNKTDSHSQLYLLVLSGEVRDLIWNCFIGLCFACSDESEWKRNHENRQFIIIIIWIFSYVFNLHNEPFFLHFFYLSSLLSFIIFVYYAF